MREVKEVYLVTLALPFPYCQDFAKSEVSTIGGSKERNIGDLRGLASWYQSGEGGIHLSS